MNIAGSGGVRYERIEQCYGRRRRLHARHAANHGIDTLVA